MKTAQALILQDEASTGQTRVRQRKSSQAAGSQGETQQSDAKTQEVASSKEASPEMRHRSQGEIVSATSEVQTPTPKLFRLSPTQSVDRNNRSWIASGG